jgi:signal peptidase I
MPTKKGSQVNEQSKVESSDQSVAKTSQGVSSQDAKANGMVFRETIESFAVALILAFLFRAFVAEAFVIPTGSMAPTLMGAHKDLTGSESGAKFQSGASGEFEPETGRYANAAAVGATCPISRFEQPLDLKNHLNHHTFSGDRILVSKFSYLFKDPSRWDVIVFKFPENARQNYIKRCVGLPNETLRIEQGDIYVRSKDANEFEIARKPPNIVGAMLQTIADTNARSKRAIEAGVPSSWQPSPKIGDGNLGWDPNVKNAVFSNRWDVEQTTEAWSATCRSSEDPSDVAWIRYYHRILSPLQWTVLLETGKTPAPIDPYSSRLISDFTSYNATIYTTDRHSVYDEKGKVQPTYSIDWKPNDVRDKGAQYVRSLPGMPSANYETDGKHWTGDLASEFELELASGKGAVVLDIVEAGVHYQCSIDVESGTATLSASSNGEKLSVIEDGAGSTVKESKASTRVRAGRSHRLRFANVDNTLTLWVDGSTVDFLPSNRVITDSPDTLSQRRPMSSASDPMDAAPIGLGFAGVAGKVTRARVWRDIYYIADKRMAMVSEDRNFDSNLLKSADEATVRNYFNTNYPNIKEAEFKNAYALYRDVLFSTPSLWAASPHFANRGSVEFTLEDDQFFPMGDNSAASSDARAWANNFIPRRLLIGRAIVVFWPHVWMEPIPYLPNIGRMGLIR